MNESLVQWTLLNNLDYLSRTLDFSIASKKGSELSTAFGRIDFILEDYSKKQMIVELETILNQKQKLNYCFDQVLSYKQVRFADNTDYCILYAEETDLRNKKIIDDFGFRNDVTIKTYSLNGVKELYTTTIEKLSLSFGLALPSPLNYTICYLRWLNKILKPFYKYGKDKLTREQLAHYFSSPSSTNFRCYLRLALDFEMLIQNNNSFIISTYGKEYVNNFDLMIDTDQNISAVNLSLEQKKLLLRILSNGNWTPHKVNVFWFLRFIEITQGDWIPNKKIFDREKLELLNGLFGVSYKLRTMYEFLNFACNWCMELELVDRIKSTTNYDRLYLTPLGIEMNNIFSLDLQLKKSRLNLNFKYMD